MRILIVHNRYQQKGGEDSVVAAEFEMLTRYGESVEQLLFDNDGIAGARAKVRAAAEIFYSVRAAKRVESAIRAFRPDVVHVHNFVATLSPSVFYAAKSCGVPVVMTLHNYRLACSSGVLFRDGTVCEECKVKNSFIPAVRHRCYRGSLPGSAALGGSIAVHHLLGTWRNRVDRYITLTAFAARLLGESSVPMDKIRKKPNFVADTEPGKGGGGYALYVGRLSAEKGIGTILDADHRGLLPLPLWIAGDGPVTGKVLEQAQRKGSCLRYLGPVPHMEVQNLMRQAEVLVLPSICYEGFPMVCVEAFALGLPVVCSRIGGLPEIVEDGICGIHFSPGNCMDLAEKLRTIDVGGPALRQMREAARRRYLENYTEKQNYRYLMNIYAEVAAPS